MRVSLLSVVAVFRRVGALAAFRPGIGAAELTAAASMIDVAVSAGIRSPWAPPAALNTVVWGDIFGQLARPHLTRAEAMRVPAVARARHIVCGTIARIELRGYRGDVELQKPQAPSWLTQTDGVLSPYHRMLWTIDDLFFYGWSLWRRTVNAAPDPSGRTLPLRTERVPIDQWQLEPNTNRVLIYKPDGRGGSSLQPANSTEVIAIPGPHEGLLVDGADSVRHAADLQRAAHRAARHPSAYLALSQGVGSTPLKRTSTDPTEVTVDSLVQSWVAAREGENGGVAYLGPGIEAKELGTFDAHLVVEGRNAANVDVARHASIPADLIDASPGQSSLTYTTSRDNDRRAIDYGLGLYMGAVSSRLTQDDVTPLGQRVAFDLEEWLQGATAAPGQPAAAAAPGLTPTDPTSQEPPQ